MEKHFAIIRSYITFLLVLRASQSFFITCKICMTASKSCRFVFYFLLNSNWKYFAIWKNLFFVRLNITVSDLKKLVFQARVRNSFHSKKLVFFRVNIRNLFHLKKLGFFGQVQESQKISFFHRSVQNPLQSSCMGQIGLSQLLCSKKFKLKVTFKEIFGFQGHSLNTFFVAILLLAKFPNIFLHCSLPL